MDTMLITGGAGFIGANFVRLALEKTDCRVVVYDKLTYAGNLCSLAEVQDAKDAQGNSRFEFVHADIADKNAVAKAFEEFRPSRVVNFAAESHVDRSIDGPRPFMETNLMGAFEMLDASRKLFKSLDTEAKECFRFLHVSTDEVYGSLGETGLFLETTPYAPNSPYSATKAGADHLVRAYHKTYGLPALITNCSNNYGPFQFPEKLIPLTLLNMMEAKTIPIYGDGSNIRDWIYVQDHCAGVLAVLEGGRLGEKYNLGGWSEKTNLEVVDQLCAALENEMPASENEAMKAKGIARYEDLKTFVKDRPGHDQRYAIDATKVRDELGWMPDHDFESGIAETVQWYLSNRPWCAEVQGDKFDRERLGLKTD